MHILARSFQLLLGAGKPVIGNGRLEQTSYFCNDERKGIDILIGLLSFLLRGVCAVCGAGNS